MTVKGWFVTGTDTGVGKTRVATALLAGLRASGVSALGMKPVASGCRHTPSGLRSEDAEALRAAGSCRRPYDEVNPYAFAPAIAPHLAAEAAGVVIREQTIQEHFGRLCAQAECVVVEGVGGWLVPLGPALTMADIARALRLPVIMVVGLRLGCLNHALLTAAAIHQSGLRLAGWVANRIEPDFEKFDENVGSLAARLDAPLIGRIPFLAEGLMSLEDMASHLELSKLGIHERQHHGASP